MCVFSPAKLWLTKGGEGGGRETGMFQKGLNGNKLSQMHYQKTLKMSVYFLFKFLKWRFCVLITPRLSEETNNKWHPEINSI